MYYFTFGVHLNTQDNSPPEEVDNEYCTVKILKATTCIVLVCTFQPWPGFIWGSFWWSEGGHI